MLLLIIVNVIVSTLLCTVKKHHFNYILDKCNQLGVGSAFGVRLPAFDKSAVITEKRRSCHFNLHITAQLLKVSKKRTTGFYPIIRT